MYENTSQTLHVRSSNLLYSIMLDCPFICVNDVTIVLNCVKVPGMYGLTFVS